MSKKVLLIGSEGYIGSALQRMLKVYDLTTCDINGNPDLKYDYAHLYSRYEHLLNSFDIVILLAGYSAVPMCKNMMSTFCHNNTVAMWLLKYMQPYQKFIYASSASVYDGQFPGKEDSPLSAPLNFYDASKMAFDVFAQVSGKNFYSLRFGTVCGRSPNQRLDILYPRMAWNAVHKGVVEVSNPQAWRSILNINDLVRAVQYIIEVPAPAGIYNVASFNTTIDAVGMQVAKWYNVDFVYKPPVPTYSFSMDCGKFEETFRFQFDKNYQSILHQLDYDYIKSMPDLDRYLRCTPY